MRGFPATAPRRFDAALLGALLLLGLYFPTSVSGNYSPLWMGASDLLATFLFAFLFLRADKRPSFAACASFLAIIPLLLVFTFTSGLNTFTFGVLAPYTAISVLFITNLSDIPLPRSVFRLFEYVNFANIVVCFSILAGSKLVDAFLVNSYSEFYPELLPNMLFLRKPVLTFATHSLAGFFLFLFFYLNLQAYKERRQRRFLWFAICYLLFTMALLSVTGLVLALAAGIQLGHTFWSTSRFRWRWAGAATIALAVFLLYASQSSSMVKLWKNTTDSAGAILGSKGNGFLARYAAGNELSFDFQYLSEHPFSPIGVSYRNEFVLVDSGMLENVTRGSVVLFLLIYGGLWFFLRRNLVERSDAYFLLGLILAFEIGFSSLTYTRTLFLLPFFVVFLNGLRRGENVDIGLIRRHAVA